MKKEDFFFQFDEMKYLSKPTFANYWFELMYWAQPNSKQFSRDCSCSSLRNFIVLLLLVMYVLMKVFFPVALFLY